MFTLKDERFERYGVFGELEESRSNKQTDEHAWEHGDASNNEVLKADLSDAQHKVKQDVGYSRANTQ